MEHTDLGYPQKKGDEREMDNFDKGAFIVSRSIFESDIWWSKPPEYLKIWMYLIGKANHKDRKYKGYHCKRGQYFCNYGELQDQLTYKIGGRDKICSKDMIKNMMRNLRKMGQITTAKTPRGTLITICNYDRYQNISNYENTTKPENTSEIGKIPIEAPECTPAKTPAENSGTPYQSTLSDVLQDGENTSENTILTPALHQPYTAINKNKELKNENNTYSEIFNFWNTKKIITHRGAEEKKCHSCIGAKLKDYSYDEIKEAITNYANILKGDEYYFNYKWTLKEFLTRENGFVKFLSVNSPFDTYQDNNNKGKFQPKQEGLVV